MSFTLWESKDFQSHSVRLDWALAAKGAKNLSLSPEVRKECLNSSYCVAFSPMRWGSILMYHAFLDKRESLFNSPASFRRWILTSTLKMCSIEHFSAFSKTLLLSLKRSLRIIHLKWNHTYFSLSSKIVKSCRDGCGLFVATYYDERPQFSNLPALPDKGIQSNAETKIIKEKYFLFAFLPLTLHDQWNLGASPSANDEAFTLKLVVHKSLF